MERDETIHSRTASDLIDTAKVLIDRARDASMKHDMEEALPAMIGALTCLQEMMRRCADQACIR